MGCLLMASSAASLCALGMLTCCTCGCAPTVLGPRVSWPCLSFVLLLALVLPVPVGSLSHMVHNLRDGVTLAGSRLVCPRSERRFHMFFSFPFGLFLRVVTALRDVVTIWVRCWSVPTYARPTVVVVLRPFSLDGLRPSV